MKFIAIGFLFLSACLNAQFSTFNHDGEEREYIYYEPVDIPDNAPLIVALHGYSDDANAISVYSALNEFADIYGFAVCYPRGLEDSDGYRFFNVGYDFHIGVETTDDVDFIESLAIHLQSSHNLDPNRTYATGLSNGGDMCYMLAHQGSTVFKAYAPVAGMLLENIKEDNSNYHPVPILEIHGTADDVTYYNGDINNNDGWGSYDSTPATMDYFVNLNNLTSSSIDTLPDIDQSDNSFVIAHKYFTSGDSCNQVWLYEVVNGGHDWPGSWGNFDIYCAYEMVQFFDLTNCDISNSQVDLEPSFIYEIYPNPSDDVINIISSFEGEQYFKIYSITGKTIMSGMLNSSVIDISILNSGYYILEINNQVKQFVVK